MGAINPIRKDVVAHQHRTVNQGSKNAENTANKVADVVQLPCIGNVGEKTRQITPLKEAKHLAKEIEKLWDSLELDVLAEKIVDLENKVSKIKDTSPEAEKVKKLAEHLHFQFVHPGAKEMEKTRSTEMPFSYVQSIREIANRMIQTDSMDPFKELTPIQQREIMRHASAGGG